MCWKEGETAALGRLAGLLPARISRPSYSFSNSLGHCGVWQQRTVQAGSHLRCHMTRRLCYGQHARALQVFWGSWRGMTPSRRSTGYSGRLAQRQTVRWGEEILQTIESCKICARTVLTDFPQMALQNHSGIR